MTTQREMKFILIIFDRLYTAILITIDAILQLCYINLFPPQHAMKTKIKDQFLFNLSPSRQSFVYRGDTIRTSLLVFAQHWVTNFFQPFSEKSYMTYCLFLHDEKDACFITGLSRQKRVLCRQLRRCWFTPKISLQYFRSNSQIENIICTL